MPGSGLPAPSSAALPPANRIRGWEQTAIFLLTAAALALGAATYGALTAGGPPAGLEADAATPGRGDPATVAWLLNASLAVVLALAVLVGRRLAAVWTGRRRGAAGARLHLRLALTFGLLAVAPALLMTGFSALFLHFGVQAWFADNVRAAIGEADEVARAYLHEHQQTIRADALAMAGDLDRAATASLLDPAALESVLRTQALLRNLTEAVVVDGAGRVVAQGGFGFLEEPEPIPPATLATSMPGQVALLTSAADDRVRAVVPLDSLVDTFLIVGRPVEAQVLRHMVRARDAVRTYQELEGRQAAITLSTTLVFLGVAVLLLTGAAGLGLTFAARLVTPIAALIGAAERVRAGELSARVPETDRQDELSVLGRTFNRMARQLEAQRLDLVAANRELDERRGLIEAVLAGVSAGVLHLDRDGRITLANRAAEEILGAEAAAGRQMEAALPDLSGIVEAAGRRPGRVVETQLRLRRRGATSTYLVRVVAEPTPEAGPAGLPGGFVVSLDDISDLLSAQRVAAWADVAQRLAHEIKNPLTPIQLSAERLKRRYLKEINSDPETFVTCTDTIVRQVGDIGRMVNEFTAFARMPGAVRRPERVDELVRQAVVLQRVAHPEIRFELDLPPGPAFARVDARQVGQALTNLIQNALDAIAARPSPAEPGRVGVRLTADPHEVAVAVEDNGVGLPVAERERLAEPYVTTRQKGTGLGLAIVKKIMEDHAGALTLEDREPELPQAGARVVLLFPVGEGDLAEAS